MTEIMDFANALRQMADNAEHLSERHDIADMAALRRQVAEQSAKAQRDGDLIAEMRRQLDAMGRQLDAIGRMRKAALTGDQAAMQILAEALLIINGQCANYTGRTCRDSGRTRGARYTADAWCGACVAHHALERAGALPEEVGA